MRYVDGFVVPVPTDKLPAYRRMAQKAGKVWMEHGALEYVECVADNVKPGKLRRLQDVGRVALIGSARGGAHVKAPRETQNN